MISEDQFKAFLHYYAEDPDITQAAKRAGLGRSTIYRRLRKDPKFYRDMARSKGLWQNKLGEDALSKFGDMVRAGKWPAVRYALDRFRPQYPSPTDFRAAQQVADKFPELAPDLDKLHPLPEDPFPILDVLGTNATKAKRKEEMQKFHQKASVVESAEAEEFEEALARQEASETPIQLPESDPETQ